MTPGALSPALEVGPEILLVRYGELALKGGNRADFERALARNIVAACAPLSPVVVQRSRGRMTVVPERRARSVARRLQDVFGIASISPAFGVEKDPDAIARVARAVLQDALASRAGESRITVRVRTRRADKSFPLISTELDRYVGDRILDADPRLKVQLDDPELSIGIDVREARAYVFAERLPGAGGLPVGTQGRGVALLSGGIDSPVAAWMALKRGLALDFVTFHSHPFIGGGAKRKVQELVRILTRFQPASRLWIVPFAEIQLAVRDGRVPAAYRTLLYRRAMQRIATRLAERAGAKALVTGESLGQVASQTLENLTCIGAATGLPVLRPLIGFDKLEIIALAKKIGTFETSIMHEPDCCTVFLPAHPVLRGRVDACEQAEAELDVAGLTERALAGAELYAG
jgi:thiamine biosynthesis protein ThiI